MTDERERRVGRNEALYRQVNERIEEINETFGSITGRFQIVCECAELQCMAPIDVSREVYEQTRANPTRFIIKPGHDEPGFEDVVESHTDYVIVEKGPPESRRIATEMDARS